jgi:hypothetical protein
VAAHRERQLRGKKDRSQREARVAEEGSIAAVCEKSRFLSGIDTLHILSIKVERAIAALRHVR